MVTEVVLPMLGITVEKGKITQWHKAEGDTVSKAEIIFTVESEKVTTDVESPATGILAKILVQEGMEVPLMTIVGVITEPGEAVPDKYLNGLVLPDGASPPKIEKLAERASAPVEVPAQAIDGPLRIVPAARKRALDLGVDPFQIRGTGPEGIVCVADVESQASALSAPKASTLAKRFAAKEGIDLAGVKGSGVRGRIMRDDLAAIAIQDVAAPAAGPGFGDLIPMSSIRQVIARRMSDSAFSAPHTYFFADVSMDALLAFRKQIMPDFEKQFGLRPSVNDFLIKAVALNIRDFPLFNAQMEGDDIRIMPRINVGLAVAQPEGLIVPAIADAERIGLAAIAGQRDDLVVRARGGQLTMEEMERGTFTISSLAQYDIAHFTAIINPPQSAILSVGPTRDQLFMDGDQVAVKKVATFGLSTDHRIIDGVQSADFLQHLKWKLERPTFTFMHL